MAERREQAESLAERLNGLASLHDRVGVQIAEWGGHDEMAHPNRVDAH